MLREINPEYSLKGLMLMMNLQYLGHLIQRSDSLEKMMNLQYFGHLIQRSDSLEKTLKLMREIESKRRRVWQRIRLLDGITNSIDMNLGKFWEMVRDREA